MPSPPALRILGFDVPPLRDAVDTVVDAPVSALLDREPDTAWIAAVADALARADDALKASRLTIEGGRVLFFATTGNARELCNQVRELVNGVGLRAAMPTGVPAPNAPVATLAEGADRRILVVEDDPVLREVVCGLLEGAGWTPVPADHAAHAIALLDTQPPVHAMFTDIHMPGDLDGEALIHIVRQRWPDVAVVATSGHHISAGLRLPEGVVLLQKPYQGRQLTALLERTFARE